MGINANDCLARLPWGRRAAILARTEGLVVEEMSLAALRDALQRSRAEMAERMGVSPDAISKLESCADIYVGALREMIEAEGGSLDIVARFPDRQPVPIPPV